MNKQARCKFCGKELLLEIDDLCPRADADFWIKMAACNRCADYHDSRIKIYDRIHHIMGLVFHAMNSGRFDKECAKFEATLEKVTKTLCAISSRFYRVEQQWSPELISAIFAWRPTELDRGGLARILNSYLDGFRRRSVR